MGATIGRFANRIGKGRFTLVSNGRQKVFNLDKNDGQNTLHGGFNSFGRVINAFTFIRYLITCPAGSNFLSILTDG